LQPNHFKVKNRCLKSGLMWQLDKISGDEIESKNAFFFYYK
jgi:hypothetical protein